MIKLSHSNLCALEVIQLAGPIPKEWRVVTIDAVMTGGPPHASLYLRHEPSGEDVVLLLHIVQGEALWGDAAPRGTLREALVHVLRFHLREAERRCTALSSALASAQAWART